MHKLIVLGGGASGYAAAIEYAKINGGENVLIIEGNDRVLKKLSLTGNGQCNLSNELPGKYFGDEDFAKSVLDRVSVEDTLNFFTQIGVSTVTEESGRIYPRGKQASAVSDALRFYANRLKITVLTNELVTKISKFGDVFEIMTNVGKHNSSYVVYALGGAAYPKLLSTSQNAKLLTDLGHTLSPYLPALVQLTISGNELKPLKGLKCVVKMSILVDGKAKAQRTDEIHFAGDALSGPVTFSLSPYASVCFSKNQKVQAKIDFFPELSDGEFLELLMSRAEILKDEPLENLLLTLIHNQIARTVIKLTKLPVNMLNSLLTDDELIEIMKAFKGLTVNLSGTYGFNYAQCSLGGIETSELTENLMSKKVENLYIVGEAVNVTGECGGYNLQWAWSSGILAARSMK